MSQQGYKVEIVFTQPLDKDDPADWILDAVTEGKFAEFTNHIHATSVSPIDLESDEYKWLRDATSQIKQSKFSPQSVEGKPEINTQPV